MKRLPTWGRQNAEVAGALCGLVHAPLPWSQGWDSQSLLSLLWDKVGPH